MTPEKQKYSFSARLKSFSYALKGLAELMRSEVNAKIHLFVSVLVLLCGFLCGLSGVEWSILLLCIALVIAMEAINTAIEKLCDFVRPEYSATIGKIKDISAAAVLVCVVLCVAIGIIIFVPYVWRILKSFS